jgi:hypothetical protein
MQQGSDLPGATLGVGFFSAGRQNLAAEGSAQFTLAPDTEKPTLKTTSNPRKGTRVKAGDQIRVRMEASEEYGEHRTGWQSGVKKIQLRDESLNRDVPPHYEDNGPMRACAQKPWKQWLEVTYTVPPNPPPVIRLRATAWDFAGNKDYDVAEFPTSDWQGTLQWSAEQRVHTGVQYFSGTIELALSSDGRGGLTGTALGTQSQKLRYAGCPASDTVTPGTFRARLTASQSTDPSALSIRVSEPAFAPPQVTPCPAGMPATAGSIHEWPGFHEALTALPVTGNDTIQSTRQAAIHGGTVRYTVNLKRAPN